MLFSKLARLLFPLAIVSLVAAGCGADTVIESGTQSATADSAAGSSNSPDTSGTSATTDSSEQAEQSEQTEQTEPDATQSEATDTASEPTPAPEATATTAPAQDASDESQDTSGTSSDDDVLVLQNRDEAIAFLMEEGFVANDAGCLADGAFQVFGTWDFADLDTTVEQDEALDVLLDRCITTVPGPAAGSAAPGTDAALDVLWVACDDGSAAACDDLYITAPVDSDYEAFGLSCGGRAIDSCSNILGDDDDSGEFASGDIAGPAAGSPPPGTNAEFDALWVACDAGSAEACDDLFWGSPAGSDYEAFGLSCGGRAMVLCNTILDD